MYQHNFLSGRVIKPLTYKNTKNDFLVGTLTVVTTDMTWNKTKKQEGSTFLNITVFGDKCKFVEKYFPKGRAIELDYVIKNNNYKDKNGNTVYTESYVMRECRFATSNSKECQESLEAPDELADGLLLDAGKSSNDFINVDDGDDSELPFS